MITIYFQVSCSSTTRTSPRRTHPRSRPKTRSTARSERHIHPSLPRARPGPTLFREQYITTCVSTTRLRNWHAGDYLVNIVERPSIPIGLQRDDRTKVSLKGPTGLREGEEDI